MQLQRVNRTQAEKIFLNVQNGTGTSITTGMGARFLGGAAAENVSTDGIQVTALESANNMWSFAGIAADDIASLGYGRCQAWGYVNSIQFSAVGSSITIGTTGIAGSLLTVGAVAGTFFSTRVPETLSISGFRYVQSLLTQTISANPVWGSGFIRAL